MPQDRVRHEPAFAAFADDLILRHPNISKKHFVEIGSHGHVDEWPNFDSWCIHLKKEEADALMFRGVRFCTDEAKYPIGQVSS